MVEVRYSTRAKSYNFAPDASIDSPQLQPCVEIELDDGQLLRTKLLVSVNQARARGQQGQRSSQLRPVVFNVKTSGFQGQDQGQWSLTPRVRPDHQLGLVFRVSFSVLTLLFE